jgi:hypothetical protein
MGWMGVCGGFCVYFVVGVDKMVFDAVFACFVFVWHFFYSWIDASFLRFFAFIVWAAESSFLWWLSLFSLRRYVS